MRKLYPCLGLLLLAGCKQSTELPTVVSPYKMDVQQGNVVTQEMLAKLKAGMTRAQVRFALGSPLVIDPFRTDRWDYVYSLARQGKDIERRRVTVIFDEDKLLRLEGDILPVDPSLISDRPPRERPPVAAAPAAEKPAAPKPEAAKPAEKPAAQPVTKPAPTVAERAPVSKPVTAKPAEKPVALSPAPKPEAVAVSKPVAPVPAPAKADALAGTTTAGSAPPEAKKADTAKADAGKEKPKGTGLFGRIMDKIGF